MLSLTDIAKQTSTTTFDLPLGGSLKLRSMSANELRAVSRMAGDPPAEPGPEATADERADYLRRLRDWSDDQDAGCLACSLEITHEGKTFATAAADNGGAELLAWCRAVYSELGDRLGAELLHKLSAKLRELNFPDKAAVVERQQGN